LRAAAHDRGGTVLIVAHDARIIPYVDRVYYLEDGRIHQEEEIRPHGHATSGNGGAPHHWPAPLMADPADEEMQS
jgi:hypothetical protein